MPSVPIYSAPTVAPTNLPDARQQTPLRLMQQADIGPGQLKAAGKGLETAGADFAQAATLDQINTNEAKGKEFDANLMGAHQGILNGTPDDPSSGYLNLKGKAAVDAYQATVQKIQAVGPELSQSLDNPAQQKLVSNTTQLRTQSAIQQATIHYNQQQQVYQQSAGQTRIKVSQDGAAQSFNPAIDTPTVVDTTASEFDHADPANNTPYQLYLQTVVSEAKDQTVRMGIAGDPALSKTYVDDQLRSAYMGTLVHLLGGGSKGAKQLGPGDIKMAQDYYDSVKDKLTAEQQDKVTPLLEAGAAKDKSLDLFFEAQQAAPDYAGRISFIDQRYKDGKITADVHDMALQRVTAANNQARAEQSEQDKATIGQVWEAAHKGGSLATLPPDTLAYIKQRGLGPQVDAIFKRNEDGGGPDDSKLFNSLARMSAEDPQKFAGMDLSLFSGQLTRGHWNQTVEWQRGIARQDYKAMDQTRLVNDTIKNIKADLLAAGFNFGANASDKQKQDVEVMETSLRDTLAAAQSHKGSSLTREEAATAGRALLKNQALNDGYYFGIGQTKKAIWQMTDQEKAADFDIPNADRTNIILALRRRNLPVTEQHIQRLYKLHVGVQ